MHGALCIAYSGRCLLSGYMSHRDSNQGACTNTCRWKYDTHLRRAKPRTGDIVPIQNGTTERRPQRIKLRQNPKNCRWFCLKRKPGRVN